MPDISVPVVITAALPGKSPPANTLPRGADGDTPAKPPASGGTAVSDNTTSSGSATAPEDGAFSTVLEGQVSALKAKSKPLKCDSLSSGARKKDKDGGSATGDAGQGAGVVALLLPPASPQAAKIAGSGATDGGAVAVKGTSAAKALAEDLRATSKGAAEFAAARDSLPGAAADGTAAPQPGKSSGIRALLGSDQAAAQHAALNAGADARGKGDISASVKPEPVMLDKVVKGDPLKQPPLVASHGDVNPGAGTEATIGPSTVQTGGTSSVSLAVEPRVGTPGWDGALGQRVAWIATQNQHVAELHLNPPNLGPLEVRVTVSNDQASAFFVSHHGAVREAIEAALPRLREMFADNGLTLGNVMVGSQSFSQQQTFSGGGAQGWSGTPMPGGLEGSQFPGGHGSPVVLGLNNGLVDTFA